MRALQRAESLGSRPSFIGSCDLGSSRLKDQIPNEADIMAEKIVRVRAERETWLHQVGGLRPRYDKKESIVQAPGPRHNIKNS